MANIFGQRVRSEVMNGAKRSRKDTIAWLTMFFTKTKALPT
jgi:hypothetical protein